MAGTREDQRGAEFMAGINNLFCSKQFSDVKIMLGEVELAAHRFVLSTQSDYFERALASKFEEAETGVFQYNEGSMHAYWRCFEYIYTGEYSEKPAALLSVPDDDDLSKNVKVHVLAHYFGIKGLRQYSLDRLKARAARSWDDGALCDCIRVVYARTTEEGCLLRRAVLNLVCEHWEDLLDAHDFDDLLREGGDFVVDIVARMR